MFSSWWAVHLRVHLRLWGDGRVGRHLENIIASMSSGGSSMRDSGQARWIIPWPSPPQGCSHGHVHRQESPSRDKIIPCPSPPQGLPHRFVSILAPLARCRAWPRCSNPTVNSSGPRAHVLGSPPSPLVPFLHRCPFHCHSSRSHILLS
jgi:hypothetical protein